MEACKRWLSSRITRLAISDDDARHQKSQAAARTFSDGIAAGHQEEYCRAQQPKPAQRKRDHLNFADAVPFWLVVDAEGGGLCGLVARILRWQLNGCSILIDHVSTPDQE